MARPQSGIIWQGPSRFDEQEVTAVATEDSRNPKTGKMVQIWFIPKYVFFKKRSWRARRSRFSVCGFCPLAMLGCYVKLYNAPLQIWKKIKKGGYPIKPIADFKDRPVRFGAYGEPALMPLTLLSRIARMASGWTGYTRAWTDKAVKGYRRYLMASVKSPAEKAQANAMGWRTFRIISGVDQRQSDEILCPGSNEWRALHGGKFVTCAQCLLCNGTSALSRRNVAIVGHGDKVGLRDVMRQVED